MLSVHVYSMCIKGKWVYKIYLHKSQYLPNRVMIRVTSKNVPSTSQDRVFLLNFISCFDRCLTDWCLGKIIDWDSATGSFIYFMPCQSVLRFLLIPHNLTWSHWVDSFIQHVIEIFSLPLFLSEVGKNSSLIFSFSFHIWIYINRPV